MGDAPVLYVGDKNVSSWSMRAFLALAFKGVPFEERTISLPRDKDRSERLKVSPTGKVPVLHHAGRVIPDSLAIIEYLEETFPRPALWPSEAGERAHARWLAAAMHSGFTKLREGMSFNTCFLPRRPAPSKEALADAAEMLALLQDALSRKRSPGAFLFGPFGAADAMYAPAVVRLTSYEVPTAATPLAAAYLKEVLAQPLVRRWLDPARALPPVESY